MTTDGRNLRARSATDCSRAGAVTAFCCAASLPEVIVRSTSSQAKALFITANIHRPRVAERAESITNHLLRNAAWIADLTLGPRKPAETILPSGPTRKIAGMPSTPYCFGRSVLLQ